MNKYFVNLIMILLNWYYSTGINAQYFLVTLIRTFHIYLKYLLVMPNIYK